MLRNKSLTDLRGIAQSYGVTDLFSKDAAHLIQEIERKQKAMAPKPEVNIPRPEYDARLMTKPPAKKTDREMLEEYAAPFIALGMSLEITDEQWKIRCGAKTDQGTLRMPPRVFIRCCEKVMA